MFLSDFCQTISWYNRTYVNQGLVRFFHVQLVQTTFHRGVSRVSSQSINPLRLHGPRYSIAIPTAQTYKRAMQHRYLAMITICFNDSRQIWIETHQDLSNNHQSTQDLGITNVLSSEPEKVDVQYRYGFHEVSNAPTEWLAPMLSQ